MYLTLTTTLLNVVPVLLDLVDYTELVEGVKASVVEWEMVDGYMVEVEEDGWVVEAISHHRMKVVLVTAEMREILRWVMLVLVKMQFASQSHYI